jgi:starvation-inducible DNA-binding protein
MDDLYQSLFKAQTSLFHLFQKTWAFHWNVVGQDFHQLHTVFGEQYNTMFEEIDRLSEHMRYLRMKPFNSLAKVVETSEIENVDGQPDAKSMVTRLVGDNKKLIDLFTDAVQKSEKSGQYATANLLQDLIETHGKFVWMLRSFLS